MASKGEFDEEGDLRIDPADILETHWVWNLIKSYIVLL